MRFPALSLFALDLITLFQKNASSVHNSTNKAACAVKLNKYTKQFKLSDNVKVIPAAYEVNGRPDMDWLTWLHDDFFKRCFPNPAEAGREMSKFNQIMSRYALQL